MMRSRMFLHLGVAAAMAAAVAPVVDITLPNRADQRTKEVAPHGPEVSRQVRRKMERERMKNANRKDRR